MLRVSDTQADMAYAQSLSRIDERIIIIINLIHHFIVHLL
jgi:hypothetical protein